MGHPSRPPDVAALLNSLVAADGRFVLTGSVAVLLQGGQVVPGDLDIVPDLGTPDLVRVASALKALQATVAEVDLVGGWDRTADGAWKWHQPEATPKERPAPLDRTPDPRGPGSSDHLLHTRLGTLDAVPTIAGRYAELIPRAAVVGCEGACVPVAHVGDLLAALTMPRRAKDAERVRYPRTLQGRREGQ